MADSVKQQMEDERIKSLVQVTSCSAEDARQYLEASNWEVQKAASLYYDSSAADSYSPKPTGEGLFMLRNSSESNSSSSSSSKSRPSGGFASLSDLQKKAPDDGKKKYYTGGTTSGLQVIDGSEEADKTWEHAKKEGVNKSDIAEEKVDHFASAGFSLAGGVVAAKKKTGPIKVTITLWKTGFTVDDKPLRLYTDPQNAEFLRSLQAGHVPREFNSTAEEEYDVELQNKKSEDYKKPPSKPFQSPGLTLGSSSSKDLPPSAVAVSGDVEGDIHSVDNSKPKTSIQIRLADGARMIAHFNLTHTVGDLRRFVYHAKRDTKPFILQTLCPTKILDDPSLTIKEAGLARGVVQQKWA